MWCNDELKKKKKRYIDLCGFGLGGFLPYSQSHHFDPDMSFGVVGQVWFVSCNSQFELLTGFKGDYKSLFRGKED